MKVVKLKVNPSSNEIKEHIKRHDEMFPRRKATSPERGKENIVRSPTNRNKYDQVSLSAMTSTNYEYTCEYRGDNLYEYLTHKKHK